MAYSSWSVVYGEQPSAAKWNILGTNDAAFNDGTGIANDAITPAKLIYGLVRSREGGNATDWSIAGTTSYDESGTSVWIECGSCAVNAYPTTITFPTAFNEEPVVLVQGFGGTSFTVLQGVTTANFQVGRISDAGAPDTANSCHWIAIGQ